MNRSSLKANHGTRMSNGSIGIIKYPIHNVASIRTQIGDLLNWFMYGLAIAFSFFTY